MYYYSYSRKVNIHKFFDCENKLSYITMLIFGSFSAAAFASYQLYFSIIFTLPLLLHFVCMSKSAKQAFLYGFYYGFGQFFFSLYWIANALFFDLKQFFFLIPFSLMGFPFAIGIYIGLVCVTTYYIRLVSYLRVLFFASIWVLCEWLRIYLFTGFPWNLLGYSLGFSEKLLQIASIFGILGLSFFVVLTSGILYLVFIEKNKKFYIILFLLLYLIVYFYGHNRIVNSPLEENKDIFIRVVQANIPQSIKIDRSKTKYYLEQYIKLSNTKTTQKIDFLIWPEATLLFPIQNKEKIKILENSFPNVNYLITGGIRFKEEKFNYNFWNSSFIIDKEGIVKNYYDKKHLVPFGEYIPFRKYLKLNVIANSTDFQAGKEQKLIKISNYPPFMNIICYEAIFPDNVKLPNNKNLGWIINLTNDGWYGDSAGPYQHYNITRVRAIEQGVPLVRAASTGMSAIFDSFGIAQNKLPLNQAGLIDSFLPPKLKKTTFYSCYGDKTIMLVILINIILLTIFFIYAKINACTK